MISDTELKAMVEKVVQRTLQGQKVHREGSQPATAQSSDGQKTKIVALGADHGGYNMKTMLVSYLAKAGYQVIDCGTNSTESVDYPDFAHSVADKVSSGYAWRGIIIDGAGIGSCMVANKVPGVRAAMCHDHATAVNSREHNDANVLTLGARVVDDAKALEIVREFLSAQFVGGRHQRRVDKINDLDHSRAPK